MTSINYIIVTIMKGFKCLIFLLIMLSSTLSFGQYTCANASEIKIDDDGYGLGKFISNQIDLTSASNVSGQYFPHEFQILALDDKSAWYKFKIETTRKIEIELKQKDSAIAQNEVGLIVYRDWTCMPNAQRVDPLLIPINKFGKVSADCMQAGEYLIQICANKNANDNIWIEVTLGGGKLPYDFQSTAVDYSKFVPTSSAYAYYNGAREFQVETSCLSLENKQEIEPSLPADYKKTAWFTFKTSANHQRLVIKLDNLNQFATGVYAILYRGDVRKKTLFGINQDGDIIGGTPSFMKVYNCYLESNTEYSLLLYFRERANDDYRLTIIEKSGVGDDSYYPPNLKAKHNLGFIKDKDKIEEHFILTCNSYIVDNSCVPANPVVPLSIMNGKGILEGYDLTAWRTFTLEDSGKIEFTPYIVGRNSKSLYWDLSLRVFNGNVKQDCNIPLVGIFANDNKDRTLCLPPGEYSIQMLGRTTPDSRNNVFKENILSDIGEELILSINFNKGEQVSRSKFGNPYQPDNKGDISEDLDENGFVNFDLDSFYLIHEDDDLNIQSCLYRTYREFHVSNYYQLNITADKGESYLIIKNRLSEGMSAVDIISNTIAKWEINKVDTMRLYENICDLSDTGWYSIVGCISEPMRFCYDKVYNQKTTSLKVSKEEVCYDVSNDFPSYPLGFNPDSNYVVSYSKTANPGTKYDFSKEYMVKDSICLFCGKGDSLFVSNMKNICPKPIRSDSFRSALYYYFILDSFSDVSIPKASNSNLILFDGDFRNDSLGLLKFSNIVGNCQTSDENVNYFCGLSPGFYTVVLFVKGEGEQGDLRIIVDKPQKPEFDHIQTAYEFPLLTVSKDFDSPYDVISCLTGSHRQYWTVSNNKFYAYPMEQHVAQNVTSYERDLWYTFTTHGAGEISVKLVVDGGRNSNVTYDVYESDIDPNSPLSAVYLNGGVDSVIARGLNDIRIKSVPLVRGKVCDSDTTLKRYFIRVYSNLAKLNLDEPVLKKHISVNLKMTAIENYQKGDFCSDAYEFNVKSQGNSVSDNFKVDCHTIGEGYGEDGSNLGCFDDIDKIKTTWLKVVIDDALGVNDITFKLLTLFNNNKITKFRLFYGYCGALTPGPCVNNINTIFTLNCMAPGDYYIQIATTKNSTGSFALQINLSPSENPNCKPSSPYKPLANFSMVPLCDSSSIIEIENWSSSGSDISYFWNLDNKLFSTEKVPDFSSYIPPNDVDSVELKLLVENTVLNSSDSLTKKVFVKPLSYHIELKNLVDSFCYGKMIFELVNNVTQAHKITWNPKPYEYSKDSSVATFKKDGLMPLTYTARIEYDKCVFVDTLDIYKKFNTTVDTVICNKKEFVLSLDSLQKNEGIDSWIVYPMMDSSKAVTFTESGIYLAELHVGSCVYNRFYKIDLLKLVSDSSLMDIAICDDSPVSLIVDSLLPIPTWSTGEEEYEITVTQSGTYSALVEYKGCVLTDTFKVKYVDFGNVIPFTDYIKCDYDSLFIKSNFRGEYYDWSNGSNDSFIIINEEGFYTLHTGIRNCDTTVSFTVRNYPNTVELPDDTSSCDPVSIFLDAGFGTSFIWNPNNEITQTIIAENFGTYTVEKLNEYGCIEIDTFKMIKDCKPVLYIPSAFSPNMDGINDVFLPYSENLVSFKMWIFNRWGENIFVSSHYDLGWDGTFEGIPCKSDVYAYVIEFVMYEGTAIKNGSTKGTVTLIR